MVSPLKIAIFTELRDIDTRFTAISNDKLNASMFHHGDSLRLTYMGLVAMNKLFTSYQFPVPVTIKSRHQMALSKLVYPYYFTSSRLVLFSDSDAMVIKLSGNIENFLETNFQLDR